MDIETIQNHVKTHCEKLGVFDAVVTEDPNTPLSSGVIASIILGPMEPDRTISGLAITGIKVTFTVRIWRNVTVRPNFGIDAQVMGAAWTLIGSLHEDVTFGDDITALKLFTGENFGALPGLIATEEGVLRVIDVTIPLQVADVWAQGRV